MKEPVLAETMSSRLKPDSGSLQENKLVQQTTVRKSNLRCTQQEALAENAKLAQLLLNAKNKGARSSKGAACAAKSSAHAATKDASQVRSVRTKANDAAATATASADIACWKREIAVAEANAADAEARRLGAEANLASAQERAARQIKEQRARFAQMQQMVASVAAEADAKAQELSELRVASVTWAETEVKLRGEVRALRQQAAVAIRAKALQTVELAESEARNAALAEQLSSADWKRDGGWHKVEHWSSCVRWCVAHLGFGAAA